AGVRERRPLRVRGVVDLPEQDAVAAVDEAERVAPGTGIGPDVGRDHSVRSMSVVPEVAADGASPRSRRTTRASWRRSTNGAATKAAITAWIARLPEPGSMYARIGCMKPPLSSDEGGWCRRLGASSNDHRT